MKGGSGKAGKRGAAGWWRSLATLFVVVLAWPSRSVAHEPAARQPRGLATPPLPTIPGSPSDSQVTVYLMTMGPGKFVWERFGHNAIWIHDPIHGTDQTYNYGLFDFHQHNFLLRFVRGKMWYWMQGFPAQSYVESYRRANRSVWIQELEIPPAKRRELQAFLEWNERPENRFYHYDYYRDNCSTRVRDALDRALGGRLRAATESVATGRTFRFHTQRLTANDPLVFTGLLVALGHPVDRPISAWEEMFLPLAMREWVRTVKVSGPDGRELPLVRSERTLFESTEPAPPASPPDWVTRYLALGVLIGGLALALAGMAHRSRAARWGFLLVSWSWSLLSGIGGLILIGFWTLTDHTAAYRNENILQANILSLALIYLLGRMVRESRPRPRPALLLAALIAVVSLVGWALKILPQFYQVNGDVIALALPAHLGIAGAVYRFGAVQGLWTRPSAVLASG